MGTVMSPSCPGVWELNQIRHIQAGFAVPPCLHFPVWLKPMVTSPPALYTFILHHLEKPKNYLPCA